MLLTVFLVQRITLLLYEVNNKLMAEPATAYHCVGSSPEWLNFYVSNFSSSSQKNNFSLV